MRLYKTQTMKSTPWLISDILMVDDKKNCCNLRHGGYIPSICSHFVQFITYYLNYKTNYNYLYLQI